VTSFGERDAAVFLHQRGSSPVERAFRSVDGAWVEDDTGRRFLDFTGNTCHNIGFAHPRLIAAVKDQLDTLPFATRGFTNEPAVLLAERLAALWPYGAARVLLGLSGADAIEMAMKLAYAASGRRRSLAFRDSWHGAALGALSAGGRAEERRAFPELAGCAHVTPFWPTDNRSPSPRRDGPSGDPVLSRRGSLRVLSRRADPYARPQTAGLVLAGRARGLRRFGNATDLR
jgi:4-aminobutyrate aminotransferase